MGKIHVKPADKTEKAVFFNQLLNSLSTVVQAADQCDLSVVVSILYRIFGSGNKVVHYSGVSYQVENWNELISMFSFDSQEVKEMELTSGQLEHEVDTFIEIFEQLKFEGFDFYYANPGSQINSQTIRDLERVSLLVSNLKEFLEEEALNGNFIEEYISFNGPELPKLQEQLHRRILLTKVRELFPEVLLYSYYTVFQKLPLS